VRCGEKRDAEKATSKRTALNAKAKDCDDMPVGALPAALKPDLAAALDSEGVELKNGMDVMSEIIKYLCKLVVDIGLDNFGALQLWWELRENCPALPTVA
jgi:hypothetical protein